MTVAPARRVAYDTIRAVTASDAYANLLLPKAIARAGLDGSDAALATELTYGTLRRMGTYDAIIAVAADRETTRVDPAVLDALRLGTHQLLATRVAPHAAVHETVELVATATRGRGPVGFANAVLRRISKASVEEWMVRITELARSDDERLGLRSAHPVWVLRALRRALAAEGRAEELAALLDADNVSPRVTMAALPGLADIPADVDRAPYSPIAFRAPGGDPQPITDGSAGRLRVQDEGSQLAALALSRARPVDAGERWLDLCAGPGGKSALLAAEALVGGARLEANEPVPARAGLVRRALAAVPLDVEVSEDDGRDRTAESPSAYDRILVDAPCTGLGALRRRPEARWRKQASDVAELAALQRELLAGALDAVKPGGLVAYVTCSPHLSETAAVVADALETAGGTVRELDARAVLQTIVREPLDLPTPLDGAGHAQLWPHRHGTDAMFISLLQRIG